MDRFNEMIQFQVTQEASAGLEGLPRIHPI